MEIKKHFKLYKSGKQWITASIATVAVSTGLVLGGEVAHAADNQPITTPAPVTTAINNSNQENNTKEQTNSQDPKTVEPLKENISQNNDNELKQSKKHLLWCLQLRIIMAI